MGKETAAGCTKFHRYTTGFTTLVVKERPSQNHKKCFRYAAKLVWAYLGKNCRREHCRCVKIGVHSMYPDPDGKYMCSFLYVALDLI
jgi:hypothetical protein